MAKKIIKPKKTEDPVEKTIVAIKQAQDDKLATAVLINPKEIEVSQKFQEWVALFIDRSNKEFWGNRTRCALKVYNTENYASAASIGHQNFKKLQLVGAAMLEEKSLGYGELMEIGAAKMIKGSYGDWESFMQQMGYFEPKSKGGEGNTFNFENLNMQFNADRKARGLDQE